MFTQTAGDDITVAEHREGDAVLLHSRYRVQIGNLEDGPLTVKAIFTGGKEKTLFSGNLPRGSHLDLPQGGGWYDAPGQAGAPPVEPGPALPGATPVGGVRGESVGAGAGGANNPLPAAQELAHSYNVGISTIRRVTRAA